MKLAIGLALCGFFAAATAARADGVLGEWARNDGHGSVKFEPCGDAVCGTIASMKDPKGPGKIGQKVFFDMKPSGEGAWAGKAFNPEDGKEYTGKMSLAGPSLVTQGCVFGGLICKSLEWTRVK